MFYVVLPLRLPTAPQTSIAAGIRSGCEPKPRQGDLASRQLARRSSFPSSPNVPIAATGDTRRRVRKYENSGGIALVPSRSPESLDWAVGDTYTQAPVTVSAV